MRREATLAIRSDAEGLLERLSPAAGTVAAVHDRSATILLSGVPVNLHTDVEAMHPLSILLPESLLGGIAAGALARLTWPRLSLGAVEYALEATVEPGTSPRPAQAEVLGANLARLDRALGMGRRRGPVNDAVFGKETPFRDPVSRLGAAIGEGRVDLMDWIEQCGAGDGATPAWDDLVTGVLLADRVLDPQVVLVTPHFLAAARTKTTAVAWWQLQFAAMGRSSLRMERLVHGLGTRSLGMPELMRGLALGHTSGSDMLSGIWLCLTRRLGGSLAQADGSPRERRSVAARPSSADLAAAS